MAIEEDSQARVPRVDWLKAEGDADGAHRAAILIHREVVERFPIHHRLAHGRILAVYAVRGRADTGAALGAEHGLELKSVGSLGVQLALAAAHSASPTARRAWHGSPRRMMRWRCSHRRPRGARASSCRSARAGRGHIHGYPRGARRSSLASTMPSSCSPVCSRPGLLKRA